MVAFGYVYKEKFLFSCVQVDLVRPRTPQQISALATTMFQSIGGRIRELKITGFYDMLDFLDDNEPMSCTVLEKIKATCHQLRTFIIRKCRFDWEPNFHDHLPSTLHKLEFHYCRYTGTHSIFFI
jgi:hypothetical protein